MKYYVITDTHLGHRALEEYCDRPSDFEERIMGNIRKYSSNAVLIHLGDVCIYQDDSWNRLLTSSWQGRKWLIKGNHDSKSDSWYLEHGWDFVAQSIGLERYGKRILLTHKPSPCVHDSFDINIHGHHHNNLHHPEDEVGSKHELVYIEHDYRPINLQDIVNRHFNKKIKAGIDKLD